MRILGLSAYYHDSAAALVEDGRIVAAAQEERFTRKKHDSRFPVNAVRYCLAEAGTGLAGIDRVVFYDKPFLKFERLLETYLAFAPRGFKSFRMSIPLWLREKLFLKDVLKTELRALGSAWNEQLLFSEHHLPSHKFNAGEKFVFWVGGIVLGLAVVASGLVLNGLVPGFGETRGGMQVSHIVHGVASMLMMALFIGHIYMGTLGVPGAMDAMKTGYVDESWAKEHHELWLDDVKAGKIPAVRSGGQPPGMAPASTRA